MPDQKAGSALREYREALGLSRAEASQRWGMSVRTLEEVESRGIRETYAGLIADLLVKISPP